MKLRTVLCPLAAVILAASPSFAGFAGTDVFVPLVGYDSAVPPTSNEPPATLWLANHSTTANALIIVQLYTAGAPDNPVAKTKVVLGPSESTTIEDPLHTLFGMDSVDGSLRLISSTEILAAIHTGSGSSTATAGAGFESVPASFAIATGESSTLLGVVETTDEGYRFSVVETSGQPATAQLTLMSDNGTMIASRSYDLPAHGQLEGSVADLSPRGIDLPSGRLKVEVTDGAGSVLAYGVRTSQSDVNDAGFAMSFGDNILVSPYTDVTSLNQLTGDLVLQAGDNVSVTTTPNGGGQPGGTITLDTPAYTAGTGLDLASHEFSLSAPYRLPQACANGQLPSWNGSAWGCSDDANTTYTAGTGLSLASDQFSLSAPYRLPQACANGQLPSWNGASWSCADDSNTTYTAGTGLSLAGNQFNVSFAGSGSANTASRSNHDHVGQTWSTSSGRVLTLNDSSPTALGLVSLSAGTDINAASLYGWITSATGSSTAVRGDTNSNGGYSAGVFGWATQDGSAKGVWGDAGGAGTIAIYGRATGTGSKAGVFHGDVDVTGTLTKGAGSFKIDDPIDPANKYLYHSFVESPDMMNIYNGNVVTDAKGVAEVVLPDWFEALNRDFRYQLTVIGQFAQAIIANEISNGRFTIRTNKPNVKVSWQVTGIRHDPYANAHRIPVEQEKPASERGYYLHPELYGYGHARSTDPTIREGLRRKAQTGGEPVSSR